MNKRVNDIKGGLVNGNNHQPTPPPNSVQLTPENAAIFSAKFLEMIVVELRRLNTNLEKANG